MGVGVANIVTYKGKGTLNARLFGGANVITREGSGNSILYLLAGANVFTDFPQAMSGVPYLAV
ncbi:hypothetical protein BSPWISOXPB_209 [uncultured Gammaproteobacteria bacterium]|nr:hypothetical protein BSPWISOXPB_209 [uncultured Gammaproteobacteria bacterium]